MSLNKVTYFRVPEIRGGSRYRYHLSRADHELESSIRRLGILQPIWILDDQEMSIVDGHRRFLLARNLNSKDIPAILFPESRKSECYLQALEINLTSGRLSLIEKVLAFDIARSHISAETASEVVKSLSLPHDSDFESVISEIKKRPKWMLEYFHSHDIQYRMLSKMIHYPFRAYKQWFKMASFINLKGKELVQILEYIDDICIRDSISANRLWDELQIQVKLNDNITRQQKITFIKKLIGNRRFPILHSIQRKMEEDNRNLRKVAKLPLDLMYDTTLETEGFLLRFSIKNDKDIDELDHFMRQNEIKNKLKSILSQMKNMPETKKQDSKDS